MAFGKKKKEQMAAPTPETAEGYVILEALSAKQLVEAAEPYRRAGWRMIHFAAVAGGPAIALPTAYACVMERSSVDSAVVE